MFSGCPGFLVPGAGDAPPPKLHPTTSDCAPELAFAFMALRAHSFYTKQMDVEGLGRKLLLTPSGDPCRTPEKQTVGTVTASHKMLTLQALSMPALQRGAAWAEERLLGALRQSVPQNGRVHLHIMDSWICCPQLP